MRGCSAPAVRVVAPCCKQLRAFCRFCKMSRAATLPHRSGYARRRWALRLAARDARRARRRHAVARGRRAAAARRCPGSCSGSSIPAPSTRSRRGCRQGVALVSATNGKTTTTAMAARDPRRRAPARVEPRRREPRSPASPPRCSRRADAELGLFEVDEGALPEALARTRPRAVSLGNLFRDQLDRYGELELVAERWRTAVRTLPDDDDARRQRRRPGRSPSSPRDATASLRFGLDDPRHARPALQHAADSKYCVRCGAPYDYAAAYVGHLGDYRCPACGHARPPLDVAAREIELDGLDGARASSSRRRRARRRGRARAPRALQRLQRRRRGRARARARGARSTRRARRPRAASARRSGASSGSRRASKTIVVLLIKNPAGANEVVRTLETGVPPVLVVALNDAIADGQDVSWIWDVDFEPLLAHVGPRRRDRRVAPPSSACASRTAGFREERLEVVPDARGARSTAGSSWRGRRASSSSSRPTRRCSRCAGSSPSAGSSGRTGRASRVRIRVGHLYPGLPEHLRRPRQHRRARAPGRAARPRARRRGRSGSATRSSPARTTSSTSAAARIASRR